VLVAYLRIRREINAIRIVVIEVPTTQTLRQGVKQILRCFQKIRLANKKPATLQSRVLEKFDWYRINP
jgi:hypothetical protein